MASTTETRGGLAHSWTLGESGWNTGMDTNLKLLSRLAVGGGVADRDLTAAPTSPSAGDAYIVGAVTDTGDDWYGNDNLIAVYSEDSAWVFITPPDGFGLFIIDELVWSVYDSTNGWSDGVSHSWT